MSDVLSALVSAGSVQDWFTVAGLVGSVAAAAGAVRYRNLYTRTLDEQAHQRELIENLSEGIYRSLPNGKQLSANRALVRLNGYDSEAEMLAGIEDIGKEWYVDPGRRDEFRAILRRDGFVTDFVSEIYRHKTRERIWITESARLVHDKNGRPLYYEGSVREITETVRKLQAEQLLQKLSNQVPGGLFQFTRTDDGQFSISFLSDGFRRLTGYAGPEGNFDSSIFADIVHPDDRATFLNSLRDSGREMKPWELEFRTSVPGLRERWLRVTAQPERADDILIWHGYIADISARKRAEMEVEKLAFYDALTGLPNRRLFIDRMTQAVDRCRDRSSHAALIFIDLDNFKTLNDTRGHDVGDAYLVQVAKRLRNCVRHEDTVARIGGDEFVIVLEGLGEHQAVAIRTAIMTANKVLAAMRDDFEIGDFSHRSSASLGVVVFDGDDGRPDELLKHADLAMYQAKAAGRNGVALYDEHTMSPESERYRLLNDFKAALSTDALELHFQPQMDEAGRLVGAEALCRWNHPERGTLLPERFVPLTEQFGLIREFGNLVLAQGIAQLAAWKDNPALARLRLAINVNVQSFSCEDFVSNLVSLIADHDVDPRMLTLELTESVMAKDRKLISRRMHELKELGVRLSLDDFGSGLSSLAHLKRLPFDELKIDGGFIADIENSESDRALVKSILGTARTLKLTAVAEHVENVRQEAFLRAFGCDFFQGYLYSPALTPADFVDFAERRQVIDTLFELPEIRRLA